MNEDYTQPFFVPLHKRHLFRGISPSGYLPALLPPEPQLVIEHDVHHIPIEPKAHMTELRQLKEKQVNFENYVIKELLPLKEKLEEVVGRRKSKY
jgi:hypothetical protein